MISGSTVRSDATNLEQYLSSYLAEINSLNGSWTGPSYESITQQAEEFATSYKAISQQMEEFANACDTYESYLKTKEFINYQESRYGYNSKDNPIFLKDLVEMAKNELKDKEKEIKSLLKSALTPKLNANSLKEFSSNTIIKLNNSNLIDSIMDQEGNVISDYPGKGFHNGNWCADFVSYTLINAGYGIEWASLAGDEDPGTIFKSLRDKGAIVHLDIGSKGHGVTKDNPEYDPDYVPKKGDVVVFDWASNGYGVNDHTGFIIKDNGDGSVLTIEGNTEGKSGSSCVAIKTRYKDEIYGYATPIKKD